MDERIKEETVLSSWLVGCSLRFSDDLLGEILSRLPLKQLLTCMFVSKDWCSIIRQGSFIQAYCIRNPFFLLLSIQTPPDIPPYHRIYCSSIDPSGKDEFFNLFNRTLDDTELPGYHLVTELINGLFCSYRGGDHLMLVNVFTGQVTQLPRPPIPLYSDRNYFFGFVPTTGLYKLLCVDEDRHIRQGMVRRQFYTLTISVSDEHFSWKKLQLPEERNRLYIDGESISVNGALYWLRDAYGEVLGCRYIISCFDLTTENFTYFKLNIQALGNPPPRLVQYRGKLSLYFYRRNGDIIIRTVEGKPEDLPVGNISTGQLLLRNLKTMNSSFTTVNAYQVNTSEGFIVTKIPHSLDWEEDRCKVGVFEQNFETLEALICRFSPRVFLAICLQN